MPVSLQDNDANDNVVAISNDPIQRAPGPGGGSGATGNPPLGDRGSYRLAARARQLRLQKKEATAHLAADFSEKYRGRFHLKWRWVGFRKIRDHFRGENWSGRIWRFVGAIVCLGSSLHLNLTKAGSVVRAARQSGQQGGAALGRRIWMEVGRTIQCGPRSRRRLITRFQLPARMT
jgi:hypothetical protein